MFNENNCLPMALLFDKHLYWTGLGSRRDGLLCRVNGQEHSFTQSLSVRQWWPAAGRLSPGDQAQSLFIQSQIINI